MTTLVTQHPTWYLRPDQMIDARWMLARLPPALIAEARGSSERPSVHFDCDRLLSNLNDLLRQVRVPWSETIADNEEHLGIGRNGNITQLWRDFRAGTLAELADRVEATEAIWRETFQVSPLAQTDTGRAVLATEGLTELRALARAAQASADAALASAELARAADARAVAAAASRHTAHQLAYASTAAAIVSAIVAFAALVAH